MPSFPAIATRSNTTPADYMGMVEKSKEYIALAEKELRFFRPSNCDDSHLGYWSENAYAVPMTGHFGESRNQTFEVELNGVKLEAIIDSGATHSFVFDSAVSLSTLNAL